MAKLWTKKPFAYLVNTRWYNQHYQKQIEQRVEKLLSSPVYINLETTNICNADCLMCPQSKMSRKKGVMELKLFKQIVASVLENQIPVKQFVLSGFGEPFTDQHIFPRIQFIKAQGNYAIKLFTNISLLDENKVEKLLASGLDEMVISFNGISKSVYEKIMRLPYERSLNNLLYFLQKKKQGAWAKPKVVLSCVRLQTNQNEIKKVKNFWQGKVDEILKPIPENWAGSLNPQSPWKFTFRKKMWPCQGMWDTLDFLWDGRVALCCRDYNGSVILGDIQTHSVQQLLEMKRILGFRQLQQEDYSQTPICYGCDTMVKNAVHWW